MTTDRWTAPGVIDHAAHTEFSEPGDLGALLDPVPVDPVGLSEVVRNLIVHYRASGRELPSESADDINLRWVAEQLRVDQQRHDEPLAAPREATSRLQGCCRDHSLLAVSALRQHGVPARTRIGFAPYLAPGWHYDHVVVEAWLGNRWVWFDPEIPDPVPGLETPMDISHDHARPMPFETAAGVWTAHRGGADVSRYGVAPELPLFGPWFVRNYVLLEVGHRFGAETLLWDFWGAMGQDPDADVDLIDELARLLLVADGGDLAAEQQLLELYRSDERAHPGGVVAQMGMDGSVVEVELHGPHRGARQ